MLNDYLKTLALWVGLYLAALVACAVILSCTKPTPPTPIVYSGYGYSSGVSEKMTTCGEFLKKYKVEPTERNWFLCLHTLGGTL